MSDDLQFEEVHPRDDRLPLVAELLRAHRAELATDIAWPAELAALEGGSMPAHCCAFLAATLGRPDGIVILAARGERGAELMGLFVPKARRGRFIGLMVASSACEFTNRCRRFLTHADVSNCVQGAIGVFKELGFTVDGTQARRNDLALIENEVVAMQVHCLGNGWGDWAVVLFNDELTTMGTVTNALVTVFGFETEDANSIMSLTHFSGRAPVWRFATEAEAQVAAGRLRLEFRNAGYGTQVDVSPVAALDSPVLLPASWPTDSPPD